MSSDVQLQRAALMRNPNFRWLLGGGVVSMLGDQLTMIALPWLVLKLTGDALALGLTIAMMSIPRAVFILLGGALVDRYSPKRVLMLSKFANAALLALLVALTLNTQPQWTLALTLAMTPHITLYVLYALALGLGLAQAFGIPSGTSIMPQAIAPEHLEGANGMLMGMRQLTTLAGPLLAAALIALIALAGDGGGAAGGAIADAHVAYAHVAYAHVANARGLALAFGCDCASFLLSAWTLSKVRGLAPAAHPASRQEGVLRSIGSGLKM